MCSYTGPESLAFWRVREPIKICHGDSHIGARSLKYCLVANHVKRVIEIVLDQLSLLFFFVCSPLGAVSVALLALSFLVIGLSIKD